MKMHVPVLSVLEKAAQEGLREGMKEILRVSNSRAPKDDLDLVKSGAVRIDDLTGQVSYNAFHARMQHENLDFTHADGGAPKFLESAAQDVDVAAFIARRTRQALDG